MGKTVIAQTQELTNYLGAFAEFEKKASGRELPWLRRLREDAFAQFCQTGFPTTRVEDWRFTNVSELARTEFGLGEAAPSLVSKAKTISYGMEGAASELVFVNGRFVPELFVKDTRQAGVEIQSLARQIEQAAATVEPHLGRYLNTARDPFCALNTAFIQDGAYIHVRKNVVAEAPLSLVFLTIPNGARPMSFPRNLIVVEDGAQCAIVEEYVSLDGAAGFCNAATELVVGDSAVVAHYRIERESAQAFNISTLRIQQGRAANVSSHSVLVGGALVRNNIHPVMAGEGGECLINGLFIGNSRQHLDNYMLVEHASPHCASRQFYNGILDDQAHGVFHGRIIVHKDAQKTDAKQTNRNLLLSDSAQIDTKPQLEIFADDVKCTHGATIGQIEETALFYLRSRGIDENSARQLLLTAFASECLDRMEQVEVRAAIDKLIHEHLFEMATNARRRGATRAAGLQ